MRGQHAHAARAVQEREDTMLPTILVVDDDPATRRLVREVVMSEGCAVVEAEHGGPVLEYMRTSTESLVVVLGLMMPDVNGEMVLRAAVSDEALAARHRIVVVTGVVERANAPDVLALRERLHSPLVAKPFTVAQLLDAVEDAAAKIG